MVDLYPTKTRLRLLRAVANGDVVSGAGPRSHGIDIYWIDPQPPHDSIKVTSRVHEMARAGWVALDAIDTPSVTEAGRSLLDQEVKT